MTASAPGGLREQRDRFVAFAFAAADVLIELDRDATIRYAAGATTTLIGQAPEALVGAALATLLDASDRALVKTYLDSLGEGDRLAPVAVRLAHGPGRSAVLGACRMPNAACCFYVTLSRPVAGLAPPKSRDGQDRETGLADKQGFLTSVAAAVTERPDCKVSLVNVAGLGELRARTDAEAAGTLMAGIGRQLQSHAVQADAAARLAEDRFSLVHDGALNIGEINQQIMKLARTLDPTGVGVDVSGVTLDPAKFGESEGDAARVLVYAINRFAESGNDLTMSALAAGVPSFIKGAVTQMQGLREDLAHQRFELVYQPIVDLAHRKLHHYEALLRFRGADSPAKRIAFAEQTGLIEELDLAVLCCAIRLIEERREHDEALQIAVNLSGRSLQHPDFRAEITRRLDKALARHLLLEVTESALIERKQDVAALLETLRGSGFRICLDDFGAGAASFDYLNAFAVDYIKIDGKYVRSILDNSRDREIVAAIIDMAKRLKIGLVAEQVESEAQCAALAKLGVQFGQGYLFGRPGALPPLQIASKIAAPRAAIKRRGGYQSWTS